MSDVWVVLIFIIVFISIRDLFIWFVRKIIGWIRLLWDKIKAKRDAKKDQEWDKLIDELEEEWIREEKVKDENTERRWDRKIERAQSRKKVEVKPVETRKIDNKVVKPIKKIVLEPQYEYIKKCNENPSYWRDTGMWVSLAVNKISNIMDSVPFYVGMEEKEWIDAAISKLMRAHEKFRLREDDPDGSGSATFHEVISALDSLSNETKIKESKETDDE